MEGIEIFPVTNFRDVIKISLEDYENDSIANVENNTEILSAKGNNMIET